MKKLILLLLLSVSPILIWAQIDSLLYEGILNNNLTQVEQALGNGVDINATDEQGATPVMWAVYKADVDMLKFLVKAGADIHKRGMILLEEEKYYRNLMGIAGGEGKLDMLKYLLDSCYINIDAKGWNTESQQMEGGTALQWALVNGHKHCIEYLIEKGADQEIATSEFSEYYFQLGNYSKALAFAEKALMQTEQNLGKQHEEYGDVLNNLGKIYLTIGKYEEALPLFQEALDNTSKSIGEQNLRYGTILQNIAVLYQSTGKYEEALILYKKVLKNTEKLVGRQHLSYGSTLSNLGTLYYIIGKYELALPLFQESKENSKQNLGTQHPTYSTRLNNLGTIYMTMGYLEDALVILQESLQNTAQVLGTDHPSYGAALGNLGVLYIQMGHLEDALPILQEALQNRKQTLGTDHPSYGTSLSNLGRLYQKMGQYEEALPLFQEALQNAEQSLGKQHSEYGIRLLNLGTLYQTMGQYKDAIPFLQEALQNTEHSLGKQHYIYGIELNNLGALYRNIGEYDLALLLLQEAEQNIKQILGKEHDNYGSVLNILGLLHIDLGQYELALPLLQEALQNTAQSLGREHTEYSVRLNNLSSLYQKTGQDEVAIPFMLELFQVLALQLSTQFDALSSRLQNSYLQNKKVQFDLLASFIFSHPEYKQLTATGFNQQLLLKGFLQDQSTDLFKSLHIHPDTNVRQQYTEWNHLHNVLARQYQKPINKRLNSFDSLRNRADELEIKLASQSFTFRKVRKQVKWEEVQATLGEDEVAVEFTHFPYYHKGKKTDSVMYVVFVLRKSDTLPKMILLFEEKELQNLLASSNQQQNLDRLYTYRGIKPRKKQVVNYQNLAEILWQPIDSMLEGINTIYYAPSGLLNRINLAAIPMGKKTLLSDQYTLVQLGNTRSLVFDEETQTDINARDALLLGGIQYEMDTAQIAPGTMEMKDSDEEKSVLEKLSISSRGNMSSWQYLPGTAIEVENISELLVLNNYEVNLQEGVSATEEYLKDQKTSPRILHIATHGYFFPDPKDTTQQYMLDKNNLPPIQLSEHPMVRSGLILAGANHVWQGNPAIKYKEDGILTAYEISRMDLSNTELVILSACDTGLGEIEGNEGVYGLQRAFKIAGAKYVLMSLWQVPDEATQKLMTAFYTEWLGGMEIREALQEAQKQIRKKYKEPYYWAGFVLVE